MKYLVEAHPSMESGNRIDAQEGGPGPLSGYVAERFKPEAMYMEAIGQANNAPTLSPTTATYVPRRRLITEACKSRHAGVYWTPDRAGGLVHFSTRLVR